MKKSLLFIPLALLALTSCGNTPQSTSSPITQPTSAPTSEPSSTTEVPSTTEAPTVLAIQEQPKDVETKFGKEVSFEVIVNNPNLVDSYQWELLNLEDDTGDEYWVSITCDSAYTNKLVIPGPTDYSQRPYRCKITPKTGEAIYSNEVKYTLTDYAEGKTYIDVGTRSILQGNSLDLSKTPFGTGIITLNEAGNKLTLDHVNFSNPVFDYDPFDSDVSLYLFNYKYGEENFTVELIGDNIINNTYYEEESKQGGIAFGFFFSGRGIMPLITIGGSGSLSIRGGSHCIYSNSALKIAANLSLDGISNHWSSGIHALDLTIEEDVRIVGHLSNYLFEVNGKAHEDMGNLTIKQNAYIDASLSPVHDSTHGSALAQASIVTASHNIYISGAKLNVDVLSDYRNLEDATSVPPVMMITNNNDGEIIIESSSINLSATTINPGAFSICPIINGIASSGALEIVDSSVNMMFDTRHCTRVVGILGSIIKFNTSDIVFDAVAESVTSIGSNGAFEIIESDVQVKVYSMLEEAEGIVALSYLNVDDHSTLMVSLNEGIALGTYYSKGETEKGYDPTYEPQFLTINAAGFVSNIVVNHYSKKGSGKYYQYFETIYNLSDTTKPLSEFVYIGVAR